GIRIVPLAEHPHLWHEAARWSFDAWRHEFPHDTEQTYLDQYARAANPSGRLIEVHAALERNESLRGLATLVDDDDLPGATEPGPWLAAVFVHESARRSGIGSRLVSHVTRRARELGHRELFLYTEHAVDWYRGKGWTVVRETTLNDLPHTVMRRDL
ncbi:MAG: GNAT family N-acetyltransferase, partial [Actinobacteria bacterium]|nr:GNAT family N-acetyltransferase [Actinomycetota bacterium]